MSNSAVKIQSGSLYYSLLLMSHTVQYMQCISLRTLQVKILGTHGGLCGDFGVDLNRVEIVSVSGYVHVVPVIVI